MAEDVLDPEQAAVVAAPPPAPPTPTVYRKTPEQHLYEMADKYHVDPQLALSILTRESHGQQTGPDGQVYTSPQGAQGFFQLLPQTAYGEFQLDPKDPFQNIEAGIRYLRQGMDKGDGTIRSVASYYHGGPNQKIWGPKTAEYAQGIEGDLRQRLAATGAGTPTVDPAAAATAAAATPAAAPAKKKPGDWATPENLQAVAAQTAEPPQPPWYQRAAATLGDVGIGALKGAGDTAVTLGGYVHKIPGVSAAVDALYGEQPGFSERMFAAAPETLAATNTAQKVGKAGEQIGELIVPAGEVSKAATAAEKLFSPSLAPYVGKTAARLAPKMAVEATGGAGMALLQGGDPKVGAAFGAAAPAIGEAAGAVADRYATGLREKAGKLIEQAFGGTSQRYKALVQKRVDAILDRGLWGSRQSMLDEAETGAQTAGSRVNAVLRQNGNQPFTGTQKLLTYLEDVKDRFRRVVPGPQGPQTVNIDPRPVQQLTKLQDMLTQLGTSPTINDMVAVRRVWDSVLEEVGAFAHRAPGAIGLNLRERTEEWSKNKAANYLRSLLGKDVPELLEPNKDFSFWSDVRDVLRQTIQRQGPQEGGIGRTLAHIGSRAAAAGVVGMGIGSGNAYTLPALGTYAVAEAGALAHQVMTSPAWRTASAQLRNSFADALSSGNTSTLAEIGSMILGTRQSIPPPPAPPGHDIALPPPRPPANREISLSLTSDPRR